RKQDPMDWLEEINWFTRINQYTDEYKLKVVSEYLQGTAGQWFNEVQERQSTINH
ncbi:1096_t:CDS:1, partial [Dentiscutata erythropus]